MSILEDRMDYYYRLEGKTPVACAMRESMKWKDENPSLWQMAFTDLGEKGRVSTVFLGSDHNYGFGAPLLFETLVFDGPLDNELVRYFTYDQAMAGHDVMVKKVEEAQ